MNRTERSRAGMGTLCVMLSALIFGVTPIMAKWTYAGGSNAVNLTLLRSLLALPCCWFWRFGSRAACASGAMRRSRSRRRAC